MTDEQAEAGWPKVNWDLVEHLSFIPHKHLSIVEGATYGLLVDGVFNNACNGVGEVMQEARTVQHLCDLAGVPEGQHAGAHIDARVQLLAQQFRELERRLGRIAGWHCRETGPAGTVGDLCAECGERWPCDSRLMADGRYVDDGDSPGPYPSRELTV